MDKQKLSEFLSKRDARVTIIEIANTLYQTQDRERLNKLPFQSMMPFDAGCVIQYFAFTQKVLVDFIFMNFVSVIGSYDSKKDSLKAWTKILFSNEDEKNIVIAQLKEIRQRYAAPRNDFICHIKDDIQHYSTSVATKQIEDDIHSLRNIFNVIRHNNNIPIVVSVSEPKDHYSVQGLKNIFSVLSERLNISSETAV